MIAATGAGSPIVLDLDGDGVETTNVKDGSYFDHDGNGFAEQTGWASSDDGILVRDINGNGSIDNGKELFGDHTLLGDGTRANNGFQALAELDDNLDGKIDANDTAFSQLKVWKDIDGDGYSSSSSSSSSSDELESLSDAGVTSINTGYTDSTLVDDQGNEHRQVGSFTKTDGTTGTATDVWFKKDTAYTIATEWLDVPPEIAALPDLQGYGNVYDLQQAMVRDTSGELKALVESFVAETDPDVRDSLMEQILFKWTGSDGVDPASQPVLVWRCPQAGYDGKVLALGTKLWVEKASGKIYLLTNDLRSFDKEASAGCTTIISQVYWEFKGFMSQQLKPCSEKKASQSS